MVLLKRATNVGILLDHASSVEVAWSNLAIRGKGVPGNRGDVVVAGPAVGDGAHKAVAAIEGPGAARAVPSAGQPDAKRLRIETAAGRAAPGGRRRRGDVGDAVGAADLRPSTESRVFPNSGIRCIGRKPSPTGSASANLSLGSGSSVSGEIKAG